MTTSGFSAKRLTRVRDVLERHVEAGLVPGAIAVVARHGEVHIEAAGTLAFEGMGSSTPMAGDTICRFASVPASWKRRPSRHRSLMHSTRWCAEKIMETLDRPRRMNGFAALATFRWSFSPADVGCTKPVPT